MSTRMKQHGFPLNEKDGNAVAVVKPLSRNFTEAEHPNTVSKEDEIVSLIPLQMSQYVSKFLKRRTNNGKTVITGKHVNQGAGYGLEIPCSYGNPPKTELSPVI